jgi:hypothetical protein
LLFAGASLRLDWQPTANAFWLVPVLLALAAISTYTIVNVEDRYLTAAFFALLLPIFASMRISSKTEDAEAQTPGTNILAMRTAASTAVVLLALLAIGESARIVGELRRNLVFVQSPTGWYNHDIFGAAHALNDLGVGPGDTVACIGTTACVYDHYWARLAGVRVLTEIYAPDPALYLSLAAMPNRDQAYDIARRQGAKVLIGYFPESGFMTGANPVSANWRELDQTHFYILPLNLPAEATPAATNSAHP